MDNREYRAAVDAYGDMVYRIALNQTRSAADADDVTQTVFMRLYAKPPADAEGDRLKHWLIRVTANECKSLWRSAWRRRVSLQEVTDEHLPPAFDEPDHERLYDALAALPEKCRIVGIREPTVRTRLTRARKLLRQQLKEAWDDDEQPEPVPSHDGRGTCPC